MPSISNFIFFELLIFIVITIIVFLFYKKSNNSLNVIMLIYLFGALFGYILFYKVFSFHLTLDSIQGELSKNDKLQIKELYGLKIDVNEWNYLDFSSNYVLDKTTGIQIYGLEEEVFQDVNSSVLINVSNHSDYVGERALTIPPLQFINDFKDEYNGIKFDIMVYKYPDDTHIKYGNEFYNPYYIFRFKVNDLYYTVRIINEIPPNEMLYTYDMDVIRNEEINKYYEYINSVISLN